MKHIMNLFYGMILGVSNVIPGVSAGTMAVILNIYDDLFEAASFKKENRTKNIMFLLMIGIGCGVGILLFSNAITFLFEKYNMITNFLFIGIILGSIPMIAKQAIPKKEVGIKTLIPCFITLFIMVAMALQEGTKTNAFIVREPDLWMLLWIVVVGAISAFSMIIPGISGSFIMLTLGMYSTVITAVAELNFKILLPTALGVMVGLLIGIKIVKHLLKHYKQSTYSAVLGLVLGSVLVIYPGFTFNLNGIFALICMCIGMFVAYSFSDK